MPRFVRRGKIPFVPLFRIHRRNCHEGFNSEKVLLLKKIIVWKIMKEITEASFSIFIT